MFMPIKNNFSELLEKKQKKENRFISLAEVAEALKVSRKTIWKWENNTVTRFDKHVIEGLCKYFGVSIEQLLEYTPDDEKASRK